MRFPVAHGLRREFESGLARGAIRGLAARRAAAVLGACAAWIACAFLDARVVLADEPEAPSPERATRPPSSAHPIVGERRSIEAAAGDSLTSIAARFGLPVASLARANGLASDARLALGQRLLVESAHIVPAVFETLAPDAILVNVPQRMLFERRGGGLASSHPIAAGRPTWQTPLGEFTIDVRAIEKPWIVPLRIQQEMRSKGQPVLRVVPPGPDNPLGHHWLGLSRSSIGIHGTNAPASIYSLRTHGCIRLHPDDVATLFGRSRVGDPVTIVYEPVLLATTPDDRICLEVHPDAYARTGSALAILEALATQCNQTARIDWTRVTEIISAKEGLARDVTRGSDDRICTPAN